MTEATLTTNVLGIETEHEQEIRGHRYTTTLYPAGEGFNHLPYLLKLLSGPSGIVVDFVRGMIAGGVDVADTRGAEFRDGLQHLAEQLVLHGGAKKVRELLAHTTVKLEDGEKSCSTDFDTVFQGRYAALVQVLAWVLEVNYAPFLRENWRTLWASAQKLSKQFAVESSDAPKSSTSPPSNGSGSDS